MINTYLLMDQVEQPLWNRPYSSKKKKNTNFLSSPNNRQKQWSPSLERKHWKGVGSRAELSKDVFSHPFLAHMLFFAFLSPFSISTLQSRKTGQSPALGRDSTASCTHCIAGLFAFVIMLKGYNFSLTHSPRLAWA